MADIYQKCQISGIQFKITEEDQEFYKMMDVPLPSLCPEERLRRRLVFRNEINLYTRKCDLSGKDILSVYSPNPPVGWMGEPFKVYDHLEWYSDKWNPMDYGRNFDFNRPFFDQFKELWDAVPKINLIRIGEDLNSDYTHDAYRMKNCYLVFDGEGGEDCYYGETFVSIKSCMDFMFLRESELCYEMVNCKDCYNTHFSRFSTNCSDSYFLMDCKGCRNCFGCANLQQKEFYIFNQPYSREDYFEKIKSFNLGSYESLEAVKLRVEEFFKTVPRKFYRGMMNENVSGDNLFSCKDVYESFDCANLRSCKFCTTTILDATNCYDITIWGDGLSRAYDCMGAGSGAQNIIACNYVGFGASNVFHSAVCFRGVHDLLGCVGLSKKRYCILNKQYSKEEYEDLLPRVIKHMGGGGADIRATVTAGQVGGPAERGSVSSDSPCGLVSDSTAVPAGRQEWGEFFPTELAPFAYNETVAQDYLPLTKEQALARGYMWRDPEPRECLPQNYQVPDHINEVSDDLCNQLLECQDCGKNYKIIRPELDLLKRLGFPISRKCFYCRYKARVALRNPRKLWERECQRCHQGVKTSYGEEREERVYCEECYLEEFN